MVAARMRNVWRGPSSLNEVHQDEDWKGFVARERHLSRLCVPGDDLSTPFLNQSLSRALRLLPRATLAPVPP